MLDVQVWNLYWGDVQRRIGSLFTRSEARDQANRYLAGLLSPAERKNSWQLAEISGAATPYGFQHLLGRAIWDADALRDRLRSYITDYLAAPNAVGVIDESGFLKKGIKSAGVARQYSGTAGKIENCQIGVFLSYASEHGHTLMDRELYLPKAWTDDRERCRGAGIPDERTFATKPLLARQMLERTFAAGVELAWIAGDSVYGDHRPLRQWLEGRRQAYVLAVTTKEHLWHEQQNQSVSTILASLPSDGWERLSAGAGSKGPRWYDWRRLALSDPDQEGFKRWLLIRRSISKPSKLTAYVTFGPAESSLAELVGVAGVRWTVEESIQTAKGEVGLDHYEVRSWTGWYRHMTLAMWAAAFLSVVRAEHGAPLAPKKGLVKPVGPSSLASFKAQRGLRCE
ncbi:MAG: IS701 family transposase [Chloroflexales bacterium]|nr:IS701 family transposase [Chloroflexales bacterium]